MGGGQSALKYLNEEQFNALDDKSRSEFDSYGESLWVSEKAKDTDADKDSATGMQMKMIARYEVLIRNMKDAAVKITAKEGGSRKQQATSGWNIDDKANEKSKKRKQIRSLYSDSASKKIDALIASATPPLSTSLSVPESDCDEDDVHEQFLCGLCRRAFDCDWKLQQHVQYSKVHELEQKAKDETFAAAYEKVQRTIVVVKKCFVQSLNSTDEKRISSIPRLRWMKAIGKVIQHNMFQRYKLHLSQTQVPLKNENCSLIFSGHKRFYDQDIDAVISIFLHPSHGVLQLLAQLLTKTEDVDDKDMVGRDDMVMSITKQRNFYLSYSVCSENSSHAARMKRKNLESPDSKWGSVILTTEEKLHLKEEAIQEYVIEGLKLNNMFHLLFEEPVLQIPMSQNLVSTLQGLDKNEIQEHLSPKKSTIPSSRPVSPLLPCRPLTLKPGSMTNVKFHLRNKQQFEQHLSIVQSHLASLSDLVRIAEKRSELLRQSIDGFIHWMRKQQIQDEGDKDMSKGRRGMKRMIGRIVRSVQVAKAVVVIDRIDFSKFTNKFHHHPATRIPSSPGNKSPQKSPMKLNTSAKEI